MYLLCNLEKAERELKFMYNIFNGDIAMKKILCVLMFASIAMASDPDLMSQWRLDETWGTKAYDSVNFYNLDLKGTVTEDSRTDGKFGGGVQLDGATNYLSIGSGTVTSFGGMRERTISMWVKFDALNKTQYIYNNFSSMYKSCLVMVNETIIMQYFTSYGTPTSASSVSAASGFVTGQWYHLAYVIRDTVDGLCTMELYVDGAVLLSKTGLQRDISGYISWASFAANGASIGGQNFFAGAMDDLRIYRKGLSAAEVIAVYNEQVASVDVADSDMISHVGFEESTGLYANSSDGLNGIILSKGFNAASLPLVDGVYGKAMQFNGTSQGALLSDSKGYGTFQNKTISMWVAPTGIPAADKFIWSMRPGSGDTAFTFYILHRASNRIRITFKEQVLESTVTLTSSDPNAPNWHHLAIAVRNTEADGKCAFDFYVDGVLMGTKTGLARHIGTSWFGASIGAHAVDNPAAGSWFPGLIDDFRIYDRALTGEEVVAIVTKEPAQIGSQTFKPADELMLNWKFDQTSGLLVKDSSGSDIYGRLKYSPDDDSQWGSGVYGNGMWFNGTSCMTLENYNSEFQFGAFSNKTVSMWVNPDSIGGAKYLFSMRPGGTSLYLAYVTLNENKVRVTGGLDGVRTIIDSTTTLIPGNWYHITAVTIPTSNNYCVYMLYINGAMEAIAMGAVNDTYNRFFGLSIGGHAADVEAAAHSTFAGTMDDFKIYGKALNSDEVKAAYDYGQVIYSDIDGDGAAGPDDLSAMTAQWLDSSISAAGSEYVIENGDFEDFADQAALDAKWQEYYWAPENGSTSSSVPTLLTNSADAFSGNQAMRWEYSTVDTSGSFVQFTEILYTFDTPVDMSGYDLMSVMLNRHAGNSSEDALYVKFLNGDLTVADIKGQALFTKAQGGTSQPIGWDQWVINLNMLQYPLASGTLSQLTDVRGFYFGCYTSPVGGTVPGGTGTIDIDDITLINIPTCGDGLAADVDGDCVVDFNDFASLSSEWLVDNN